MNAPTSIPAPLEIDQINQQAHALRHSDTRQALELCTAARTFAQKIDYQKGFARSTYLTSLCSFILAQDNEDVLELALQALSLFQTLKDIDGEAQALNLIATIYDRMYLKEKALEHYHQSLNIRVKIGDLNEVAFALNNIGLHYYESGMYKEALDHLSRSLEIALQGGDSEAQAYALCNLGNVYHALHEEDKAIEFMERSLDLNKNPNDRAFVSSTLADLSLYYAQRGDLDLAVSSIERSLSIAQEVGNVSDETIGLINLGRVHQQRKDFTAAQKALGKSKALTERTMNSGHLAETLLVLGHNFLLQNNSRMALPLLDQALEISTQLDILQITTESHLRLSDAYQMIGDWENAYRHHVKYFQNTRSLYTKELERDLAKHDARSQINEAQKQLAADQEKINELSQALNALNSANEQKANLVRQLEVQTQVLEQLAREDGLTGTANRRWLDIKLSEEVARARQYQHPLSVVMVDFDDFKSINDSTSHLVGDKVLIKSVELIRKHLRPGDTLARYGGDEFTLILIETPITKTLEICTAILEEISMFRWQVIHPKLENISISIGFASNTSAETPNILLEEADAQLYFAKKKGKGQISFSLPDDHSQENKLI